MNEQPSVPLLADRVHWLRFGLVPTLVGIVVVYQLGVAQTLERLYGATIHYAVEISFYSLSGPIAVWLILVWVERSLREKERLEAKIQAVERERAAVVAEERARIARDLHDSAAQTLYFVALKTDALRSQPDMPAPAALELGEIGRQTRRTIRDIRRTIFALQPPAWLPGHFLAGLANFVDEFADHAGWQAEVDVDTVPPPPAYEPVLFRVVQESLNNVAKHAEAKTVTVRLAQEPAGGFRLTVADDGAGFDPAADRRRGLGLKQMAGRVAAAGGTFHLDSRVGQGTLVQTVLPPRDQDE